MKCISKKRLLLLLGLGSFGPVIVYLFFIYHIYSEINDTHFKTILSIAGALNEKLWTNSRAHIYIKYNF